MHRKENRVSIAVSGAMLKSTWEGRMGDPFNHDLDRARLRWIGYRDFCFWGLPKERRVLGKGASGMCR